MANPTYTAVIECSLSLTMTNRYGQPVAQTITVNLPNVSLAGTTNASSDLSAAATAVGTLVTAQCTAWVPNLINMTTGLGS